MSQHTDADVKAVIRAATDAGASGAFVAVLATDADGRHLARNKACGALFDSARPTVRVACTGGHFMTALWEGRTRDAWRRADGANRQLMRDAGLAPAEASA